eukprot:12423340-Heterocapsa_arctica.AAC.1
MLDAQDCNAWRPERRSTEASARRPEWRCTAPRVARFVCSAWRPMWRCLTPRVATLAPREAKR